MSGNLERRAATARVGRHPQSGSTPAPQARLPDWERRLLALVEKDRDRPYQYGRHDCLLWAANAVKAVIGKDFARGHRGKYKSAASASRYLRQAFGVDTPEALLDSLFEEKPIGFAQRGDIVLAKDGIPAVVLGDFALSIGEENNSQGLVRVPRQDWAKAWAIGEQHADAPRPRKRRRKAG